MLSGFKQSIRGYVKRHCATILTYHSVVDRPTPYALYCHLMVDKFEQQIEYLAKNRNCVSVSQLIADIKANRVQPYTVAITFDDGFLNNLTVALPILQKYAMPATFFVATGHIDTQQMVWPEVVVCLLACTTKSKVQFLGKELALDSREAKAASHRWLMAELKKRSLADMLVCIEQLSQCVGVSIAEAKASTHAQQLAIMSWQQIRTLAESPLVELAAHTINHPILSNLPDAEAQHEIVHSKRMIEEHVKKNVRYFAYPNGGITDYTQAHRQMAIDAGYEAVFTAQSGSVQNGVDVYSLLRMGIGADATLDDLRYSLNGGLPVQEVGRAG